MRGFGNHNHGNSPISNYFSNEYNPVLNSHTSIVHCIDHVNELLEGVLSIRTSRKSSEVKERNKKDSLYDGPSWSRDPYKHDHRPSDNDGKSIRADYPQLLKGTVTSGLGKGKEFVSLEGYKEQFIDKLGYEPYPGTLNISLTEKSTERRPRLESQKSIPIDSWEDGDKNFGSAQCYPVTVHGDDGSWYKQAHVIVPKRTSHEDSEIELLSDVKLRDKLNLSDEDMIEIITK